MEGAQWLQGRGWAYQLLIDFLRVRRDWQIAPWQRQAGLREELAPTAGGRRLQDYLASITPDRLLAACRTETEEYGRLFVGRNAVFPCVRESAYRTGDARGAWRCPRQIREAYEDCGIVFNKLQSETDDHLTIELEFSGRGRGTYGLDGRAAGMQADVAGYAGRFFGAAFAAVDAAVCEGTGRQRAYSALPGNRRHFGRVYSL
ncbi:molecular chaperone TorD family protein [Paenibacillus sp. JTLBN-2024]